MRLPKKYKPKKTSEVIGQAEALSKILRWLGNWKKGRALIITGPTGVGKTATVHALAAEKQMEILEIGPEDKDLERLLPALQQRGLLGKKKLIVVDSADRMPARNTKTIIQKSIFPVLLSVSDLWANRLRTIRPMCEAVTFRKVPSFAIEGRLAQVAIAEQLRPSTPLKSFASLAEGDVRAALIDMDSGLAARDRSTNVFETLRAIFRSPQMLAQAAIESCDKDPYTLKWWIAENLANEFRQKKELASAYELLSKADISMHRSRTGSFMLSSFGSLREKPGNHWVSYRSPRPPRPANEELVEKLAAQMHCSTRKIKKELFLLKKVAN